jgi:hypothetical protein
MSKHDERQRRRANATEYNGYAPQCLDGKGATWFGPPFRESQNWHVLAAQGLNPPRTILPAVLFAKLRGGRRCNGCPHKNILIYPSIQDAFAALKAAMEGVDAPCCHQCQKPAWNPVTWNNSYGASGTFCDNDCLMR